MTGSRPAFLIVVASVLIGVSLLSARFSPSGASGGRSYVEQRPTELPSESAGPVTLTYLGAAGWEVSDGKTVLLVDPYLSRIPENQQQTETVLVSNGPVIDAHIQRADFILVHHSHFDHVMDVPYIAKKTGATVIGRESSTNLAAASGIGRDKLIAVRGGEDFQFPTFSVRVIPSLHSANTKQTYYDSRAVPPDIRPPFRFGDLVEGGSLIFVLRFGGYEILTMGSMNYIEREMEGLRPDVVLVGAGFSRAEIYDYSGRLMRALGWPSLVIPTHWDNFSLPYDASQDAAIKAKVEPFLDEMKVASPKTRVIVPKYFEPIALDAKVRRNR